MPDDNVIDLNARRRLNTPEPIAVNATTLVRMTSFGFAELAECDGPIHWFKSVPGPCKCGQETWDGEP